MSKSLKIFIFLVALAVIFASAAPAFAAQERSITLLAVEFIRHKGVVFTFKIKGEFDSFKGTAKINGQEHRLVCNVRDDGVLSCTLDVGGKKYIGALAQVFLNGYDFSGVIRPSPEYCAYIYDINPDLPEIEIGDPETNPLAQPGFSAQDVAEEDFEYWVLVGEYCQDDPIQYGDSVYEYSEPWEGYYTFYYVPGEIANLESGFWDFLNGGPGIGQDYGDAFYYLDLFIID